MDREPVDLKKDGAQNAAVEGKNRWGLKIKRVLTR